MQNIPVLHVTENCLAAGYEKALIVLYEHGTRFRTQYDKPGDPLSLDCTLNLTVLDPLAEPMIHKAFPGGIEDLREYVMEIQGVKDHWVKNMNDSKDTRWEYTYHGRLVAYGSWQELRDGRSTRVGAFSVNQVERVIEKLAAQPFTRQAQMITWMPNIDLDCYDPPCLQSIWYRLLEDEATGEWWLNCNIRFRSNDAWGASFMNMFGFIMFNRDIIAAGIAKRTGKTVKLGRLNWQADSYHIYGKDIAPAKQRLFDRFATTTFEERTYRLSDPAIREIYDEAEAAIRAKIAEYDHTH
ncbi:MAG: thymidylate synthase [Verrucomicrobiia bacterium]